MKLFSEVSWPLISGISLWLSAVNNAQNNDLYVCTAVLCTCTFQ